MRLQRLNLEIFGESHGPCVGGVLSGFPSGVKIDLAFLQNELDKRRPGQKLTSPRKESDKLELLSGVFDGLTTGMPIAFMIRNSNQHSKDYENLKDIFRPSHGDFTYEAKFGIRDFRGGGSSSARLTAPKVAAGAFAKLLLREFNIEIKSGIFSIGDIEASKIDFEFAKNSEIFSLDEYKEKAQIALLEEIKKQNDSIGACVFSKISNVPKGLGEPHNYKLDSALAAALVGINGVKAVTFGAGVRVAKLKGSQNNDEIYKEFGKIKFKSNNSGGILAGISNGDDILIKTYFKPTPSIAKNQNAINKLGENLEINIKGRHDPCIGIRGNVVVDAVLSLVIADMMLLNLGSKLEYLKKIYEV